MSLELFLLVHPINWIYHIIKVHPDTEHMAKKVPFKAPERKTDKNKSFEYRN